MAKNLQKIKLLPQRVVLSFRRLHANLLHLWLILWLKTLIMVVPTQWLHPTSASRIPPIYLQHQFTWPKTPTSIEATAVGPISSVPGLVVPGLAENILSIRKLADHGFTLVFTNERLNLSNHLSPFRVQSWLKVTVLINNTWHSVSPVTTFPTSTSPTSLLMWHLCLSHLGEVSIRRLDNQRVIKVTDWDRKLVVKCETCRNGRLAWRLFRSRAKYRDTHWLVILHLDVCQIPHTSCKGFGILFP